MGMYSQEERELLEAARDFALGAIRPNSRQWDHDASLPAALMSQLAELGFWGLRVPEVHGGLGLELPQYVAALEGLAWGDAAVSMAVAIHNGPALELLLQAGTDAQRKDLFPVVASGEKRLAFAFAERDAGADLSAIETRAEFTGTEWSISGRKEWVTGGDGADAVVVIARDVGSGGPTAFFVPRQTPGYSVEGRDTTLGFLASETSSLRFEDLRVPDALRIGEVGEAGDAVLAASCVARIGVAAQAVGIGQAALEHARDYALERSQFGKTLSQFGAIRDKIGEMVSRVAAARALVLAIARQGGSTAPEEGGLSFAAGSAVAKLVASEAAVYCADEAVQIFGGYGYMRHYPVEKLLRDAQGTEIFEGTSEALRGFTAEAFLSQF